MLVSANWLQELLTQEVSHTQIVEALTSLGLEVESAENQSQKLHNFFVGQVVACEPHPDADKLRVCTVDVGENEHRTIVCGAPNVASGQTVPVAIEGAIVPSAGFEIGKRKLRGVESRGMICSQAELEVGEDHDGIWVLEDEPQVGTPLSEYLQLNDTIIDIAITPNRSDCTSHIGVARDLAAYFQCSLKEPEVEVPEPGECPVSISIEDAELCSRYAGLVIENVNIVESPTWLQQRLAAIGLRPRNVVVDVTNLVLMECGHPLHAFDADTLSNNSIVVKAASEAQEFVTLDDKKRDLKPGMLMINDGEGPVAVAGVMGGQNSEISDATTTVFLESAYFQASSVRKTARSLGIHSDASYRFERGADINRVPVALWRAAHMIAELAGGNVRGGWHDEYPAPSSQRTISLRYERTRALTGANISDTEQRRFVLSLGFEVVEENDETLTVSVPSWRVDMSEETDLIEECLRLYGYDNVAPTSYAKVPHRVSSLPEGLSPSGDIENVKTWLRGRGFAEMYNQCIIHPADAQLYGDRVVELSNPLGEEMSAMRPSLIPSLAKVVGNNNRRSTINVAVFEVGTVFSSTKRPEANPGQAHGFEESTYVLCGLSGNRDDAHWSAEREEAVDFFDIKGIAEQLLSILRVPNPILRKPKQPVAGFGGNVLEIVVAKKVVGAVGALAHDLLNKYDAAETYAVELNLSALAAIRRLQRKFTPTLQFPNSDRDLAFVVDEKLAAGEIEATIRKSAGKFLVSVSVFDVFRHDSLGADKKSVAYQLVFNGKDRTLKDQEVDQWIAKVVKTVKSTHGGDLR